MLIDTVRQLDYCMDKDYKKAKIVTVEILNKFLSQEWELEPIPSYGNSFDAQFSNGKDIIRFSCLFGNNINRVSMNKRIMLSLMYGDKISSTILLARKYDDQIIKRMQEIGLEYSAKFQLLNITFLKEWAKKIDADENPIQANYNSKIISFSVSVAKEILNNSEYINILEWRDVERLVGHLLNELGYDAEITAPGNDGGIDILVYDGSKKYYIQVKHWKEPNKPGKKSIKEFMKVVINEDAESGIFLSSSGYRKNSFETLTEIERKKLHIGNQQKIASWVNMYFKINNGIYLPLKNSIDDVLYSEDIDFSKINKMKIR